VKPHIGSFDKEEDAARAYNTAALEHGLTTDLNLFPSEQGNGKSRADPSEIIHHPMGSDLAVAADPSSVSIQPDK
jgi:hypothetical protein